MPFRGSGRRILASADGPGRGTGSEATGLVRLSLCQTAAELPNPRYNSRICPSLGTAAAGGVAHGPPRAESLISAASRPAQSTDRILPFSAIRSIALDSNAALVARLSPELQVLGKAYFATLWVGGGSLFLVSQS